MRRVRFTTHLPLDGTRIGLTVWVGSVERGWIGKRLAHPWRETWRISGVEGVSVGDSE